MLGGCEVLDHLSAVWTASPPPVKGPMKVEQVLLLTVHCVYMCAGGGPGKLVSGLPCDVRVWLCLVIYTNGQQG